MRGLILKASREEDLYVIWSGVVDAPTWVGNRADLLAALQREWEFEHPHATPKPGHGPADRVTRADETGSSSIEGGYGWDSPGLVYEGRAWLPRHRVGILALRLEANRAVEDLLESVDA